MLLTEQFNYFILYLLFWANPLFSEVISKQKQLFYPSNKKKEQYPIYLFKPK